MEGGDNTLQKGEVMCCGTRGGRGRQNVVEREVEGRGDDLSHDKSMCMNKKTNQPIS